jgi:ABC-2 type transport system permease protein
VSVARVLALGWWLNLKILARSAFDGILGVVWPLFFATIAFFMYGQGSSDTTLLSASLGASVMGVWSATSTSASSAIQRQRRQGTLELLVAAPRHFSLVLLPVTVAMSTIGLYSMVATLLWGRFLFGIHVTISNLPAFALAVPITVVSVGMLGFLLSVTVVRYRTAWALGNALEYPVWLVCGFLVPLQVLPVWVRPISWLLAPTWGINAIRESALGGSPWPDLALCAGLAGVYTAVGVAFTNTVLHSARSRATLALT